MELANARKMVLIGLNEYKELMMCRGDRSNIDLSRQKHAILEDKSLSDSDKILLYNKMSQRSKALGADKRKEKYFEADINDHSSHERNTIFLEDPPLSSSKNDPIEKVKRKIDFSTPNSSEIDLTTTPVGEESHEVDDSLKRKKNLNRKKMIKPENKMAFKQGGSGWGGGGGISSWTILN